jgi:hypothetical protein
VEFTITLTGKLPLLMHNARMADPLDPIVKAKQKFTSKQKKTDADHEEIARLDFLGGLYTDPDVGPYIPGDNFQRCLLDSAKMNRLGPKVERGVFIDSDVNPLAYAGPRTPEELWANERFRFRRSVKIGKGKTAPRNMSCRPVFAEWKCQAHGLVDESQLSIEDLAAIADNAGTFIGIGDWRPRFGRFSAIVEKV